MKRTYIAKIVKIGIFLILLYMFTFKASYVLKGNMGDNFQQSAGFFQEPKNSLDAVFIGASPTFTSWVAPLAWRKYGIAVRTFGNNTQPFVATKNLLYLAKERQPNAVYMIAINGLYGVEDLTVQDIHATTDYLPISFEKLMLINDLCKKFQSTFSEKMEIFIPLVRYHSRWNSLNRKFFHDEFELYKGGFVSEVFFNMIEDISASYFETTERETLPDFVETTLTEMLDYCKAEKVKVVFVLSAQYRDEQTLKWYNTMIDKIESYGFPLINELEDFDKIGLDAKTDFYNEWHTNIHGALKITDYLSKYLIKKYNLIDKRDNPVYTSWDDAYELYSEIIKPYLRENELNWLQ